MSQEVLNAQQKNQLYFLLLHGLRSNKGLSDQDLANSLFQQVVGFLDVEITSRITSYEPAEEQSDEYRELAPLIDRPYQGPTFRRVM